MKPLKTAALSFFAGLILSAASITAYANCPSTITWRDANECHIEYTGHLTGQNCDGDGVCVCSYAADNECGHWVDGPCPESGSVS
jgi:hypothetical protein